MTNTLRFVTRAEAWKIAKANIPDGWKLPDCIMHLPAPVLPADFWKMLDFLITMMDKEGNQADVASGNAAPGWSGEAISSLQNAHNQLVRASGLSTEDWLRDLTELKINSIVHLMSPEDCARLRAELETAETSLRARPPAPFPSPWQAEAARAAGLVPRDESECFVDVDGSPLLGRLRGLARTATRLGRPILFQ